MKLITSQRKPRRGNSERGTGMVEVLIASGILAVILITIINTYHSLASLSLRNTDKIQSTFLLEEGVEAVRIMRDSGWTTNIASLNNSNLYYLRFQNGTWVATTSIQIIDGFYRTVALSDVNRDGSFNIVTSGGSVDANSRKATISVSWATPTGTSTASADTYIFNSFNN